MEGPGNQQGAEDSTAVPGHPINAWLVARGVYRVEQVTTFPAEALKHVNDFAGRRPEVAYKLFRHCVLSRSTTGTIDRVGELVDEQAKDATPSELRGRDSARLIESLFEAAKVVFLPLALSSSLQANIASGQGVPPDRQFASWKRNSGPVLVQVHQQWEWLLPDVNQLRSIRNAMAHGSRDFDDAIRHATFEDGPPDQPAVIELSYQQLDALARHLYGGFQLALLVFLAWISSPSDYRLRLRRDVSPAEMRIALKRLARAAVAPWLSQLVDAVPDEDLYDGIPVERFLAFVGSGK